MRTAPIFRLLGIVVVLTLGVIGSSRSAHAGPAWGIDSDQPFRNNSWSFGEIFTVGGADITVTALGAYDDAGDGFISGGGIPVGIFRESDGALLTSTNVVNSDPLTGVYRFHDIADVTLLANTAYRVVAVNLDDLYNVAMGTPDNVDPSIAWNGYGYCNTTALTKCDNITGTERTWMANMFLTQATVGVPEAPTLGLLGLALAVLGFAHGRKGSGSPGQLRIQ